MRQLTALPTFYHQSTNIGANWAKQKALISLERV